MVGVVPAAGGVCETVLDGDGSAAALLAAAAAAWEVAAMASDATVREQFSMRSAAQTKRGDSREGRIMVRNIECCT